MKLVNKEIVDWNRRIVWNQIEINTSDKVLVLLYGEIREYIWRNLQRPVWDNIYEAC